MPEVLDDGVSGRIVDDIETAAAAVAQVALLDRRGIRDVFERRFSAAVMADGYLQLYRRLAGESAFEVETRACLP